MPVLFPRNTEFKSQIALTSLLLPKDKTVTKDVLRKGTGVKYCLINKNDPAEFIYIWCQRRRYGFGGTSNKINRGKSKV